MSVSEKLAKLEGNWTGTNRLHLPWIPDGVTQSDSTSSISLKTQGKVLSIEYTWEYEAKPQDGLMLISQEKKESDDVTIIFTDSWHSSNSFMRFEGKANADGSINVMGYYSVPDNPDWGWRTEIHPGDDEYRFVMYNVSPEGKEDIAVEGDFRRA